MRSTWTVKPEFGRYEFWLLFFQDELIPHWLNSQMLNFCFTVPALPTETESIHLHIGELHYEAT